MSNTLSCLKYLENRERYVNGLRKAGMSDKQEQNRWMCVLISYQ
jgi:hypothetical protein